MPFKFEKLEVWQLSLEYLKLLYRISARLPSDERYNLKSQIRRAGTSINLNIAEGSTSQTDAEQTRFLGMAIRSLYETVSCLHIIHQLDYCPDREDLRIAYRAAERLSIKLHNMRKALSSSQNQLREPAPEYFSALGEADPFA
ncbi:MAG: four helix bundle protein [Chloroflexi bacterium]|nr:four helix bundle protein [Chloroflexota bacterium]